jgi:protein involved in polysaccharide export with SLBB domain
VDLKGGNKAAIIGYESMMKVVKWLTVSCFLAGAVASVVAQSPTQEDLRRFQSLTPEQRAAIMKTIDEQQQNKVDERLQEAPRLVMPLDSREDRRSGRVTDDGRRGSAADTRRNGDRLYSDELYRDRRDGDRLSREGRNGDRREEDWRNGAIADDRAGPREREEVQDDADIVAKERADEAPPLEYFGYDLFAGVPTTFAPATDIPMDADYIVGPGDTVQIQLFGKEPAQYDLVITREGILQFPEIGPISVAGLSFDEMKQVLRARIEEQMIGEKANITMGRLRSIRVFILGDVNQPGSYTVSALSTMTNALFVSGGIKPIGSLRNIQLKRRGKVVSRMDLYDLLLHGDTSGDVRLQPGDVIFVPPVGPSVGVAGEVRRPAIYELRKEQSVEQMLSLAGGLLPTAYPQASKIERISKRGERTLIDLDVSQKTGLRVRVQSGDVVRVYSILEKMEDIVLLSGHVQRPGGYQWRPGLRVSDLIPSIENDLLPRPDLDYALVRRELKPDHRIQVFSVQPGKALEDPASNYNVELQSRDELILFGFQEERQQLVEPLIEELQGQATFREHTRVVTVGGLVRFPGDYPLEKRMIVSDLIRAGGGLAEAAYALGAELTRYEVIDGSYREVDHVSVDLAQILKGSTPADLVLRPHDVLHVKRLPEWVAAATVEVRGEIRFPGVYPISRGEQLSKLIERAGGVSDMAFTEGAVFLREDLRVREEQRLVELSQRLEADLAALSLKLAQEEVGQKQSLSIVRELGAQLRAVKPTGRLVIDLPRLITDTRGGRRSQYDVTLTDGDRLYIPPTTQEVMVTGEVFNPTSHLYKRGLDRHQYVKMSGGATRKADERNIYVIRADGSVVTETPWIGVGRVAGIKPGDTIVVPLDVDRIRPIALWTSISQIVFQLGLAAASANAVGVF